MTMPSLLVAGHQPNYLPWLGFFHKLAQADRFMLVDTVQFVKRGEFGWMHRNKIRTQEGWQWLSVPVLTKGKRDQEIAAAEINNQVDWRRKHWRAIEFNYRSAPFFRDYAEPIRAVYEREWTTIGPLAAELIRVIAGAFSIETPVELAAAANVGGEAHTLLANICKHYGSSTYLSGPHGRDYLDLADMRSRGVAVVFQQFTHPVYRQCQPGPFEPGMCALDLLFNEGPRARDLLLAGPNAAAPVSA